MAVAGLSTLGFLGICLVQTIVLGSYQLQWNIKLDRHISHNRCLNNGEDRTDDIMSTTP